MATPNKAECDRYAKSKKLVEKIKPIIQDADLKGHCGGRHEKVSRRHVLGRALSDIGLFETSEQLDALLSTDGEWVDFSKDGETCPLCGEDINLEFNGTQVRAISPCRYEHGVAPHEVTLNIPSGKMVVANDLRDIFRTIGDYDVNTTAGCNDTTDKYAEVGMFHAFVGNTCPAMFRKGKAKNGKYQSFSIGTHRASEDRQVAGICTDLWWVSIADYDSFIAGGGKVVESYHEVVDCVPGIYRFKHYYTSHGGDHKVFTEIDRIGEVTTPIDYKQEFLKQDYTIGQVLYLFNQRWDSYLTSVTERPFNSESTVPPTADELKAARVQRMLDQIFFTCGNGQDWHPNGWSSSFPMPEGKIPELDIPELTKRYHWYPTSDYSFLAALAGIGTRYCTKDEVPKLNKSFWTALVKCLKCISTYGVEGHSQGERQQDAGTKNISEAALVSLISQYPEFATKEDLEFIQNNNLENALETYKTTQQLEAILYKKCPQPNNPNNKTIMACISDDENSGSNQIRKVEIAVNVEIKQKAWSDHKWTVYAKGTLEVAKVGKDTIIKWEFEGNTKTLSVEEAEVEIPKDCKAAITKYTPTHVAKLPKILSETKAT